MKARVRIFDSNAASSSSAVRTPTVGVPSRFVFSMAIDPLFGSIARLRHPGFSGMSSPPEKRFNCIGNSYFRNRVITVSPHSRMKRSLSGKCTLIQKCVAPASAAASIFLMQSSTVPAIAKRSAR